MWILLVLLYGICKGARDIFKKLAMNRSSVMQVLFLYTAVSFVMVLPWTKEAFSLTDAKMILPVLVKAFVIFIAWLSNFYALNKMPVSVFGVLDLSRVIFSTLFGVLLLSEDMGVKQIIGLALVCLGLLLLKFNPKRKTDAPSDEKVSTKTVIVAFVGCFFTALSGLIDKLIMQTGKMTSAQLQYWYCLFLLIFYAFYMLAARESFAIRQTLKNPWIYLMSASLVIGDRALFIANADPACKVTLMTLIKQSSCVVVIIGGKFIFKEKRIVFKLICALVVTAGILIAVL